MVEFPSDRQPDQWNRLPRKSKIKQGFKFIFASLPNAIMVEDCSALMRFYRKLQKMKIKDYRRYLLSRVEILLSLFREIRILDMNAAAYELYEAKDKKSFIAHFGKTLTRKNIRALVDEFLALVKADPSFRGEFRFKTLAGRWRDIRLRFSIPKETEKSLDCVIFSLEDITEQKKLEKYLKKIVQLDGLTGLLNHHAVVQRLDQEISRAKRHHLNLSCLMMDVDHFKWVNDHLGHQKGDQMIKQAAQIIRNNIRRSDIAGRYGGDEFLVILPETKPQDAVVAALRIQKYFQQGMIRYLRQDQIQNALSIGISGFPEKGIHDARSMIKLADQSMYLAKRSGGNRILHPKMISQRGR